MIRAIAGPGVTIVDPAVAVARQLERRLRIGKLLSSKGSPGIERFWTSGVPRQVQSVVAQLWGKDVEVHSLPSVFSAP
jgi:glutamate racemase